MDGLDWIGWIDGRTMGVPFGRCSVWSVRCLVGLSVGWSVGRSLGRFVGRSVGHAVGHGQLVVQSVGQLVR